MRMLPMGYNNPVIFGDAHGYLLALKQALNSIDLVGAEPLAKCIARIESFVLARTLLVDDTEQWVQGNGGDQTKWNDTDGTCSRPRAISILIKSSELDSFPSNASTLTTSGSRTGA